MRSRSPFRITSSNSDRRIFRGPVAQGAHGAVALVRRGRDAGVEAVGPHTPVSEYAAVMKTMTIRLPDALASEIEAESRQRKLSKSDVVRERLGVPAHTRQRSPAS